MSSFSEEYHALEQELAAVLQECGKAADSVKILAVSKTFPAEAIQEAYACGVRCFGENKVQELSEKAQNLPDDIEWHFIGHLQSNKAAKAVQYAAWIHSVDSLKLLNKLDRAAGELGKKPVILLEVNSGEASKSGVDYNDLPALAEAAANAQNLQFKGLMTMAPLGADSSQLTEIFSLLAALKAECCKRFDAVLPELSMGMSGDFPEAIACGATIVRIGSRIFK